jgi:predicted O-methyltransferase YrrM
MNSGLDETRALTQTLDGWLHDSEGELLYKTAKNCMGSGVIVEIGSWKGKSTSWIGRGSKQGTHTKVFAVDPHIGSNEHQSGGKVWTFEEFKQNIQTTGVEDIVVPLVKTSEEAAREFTEPVEFVFIDGAHEYEYVKQDFDLWFPKVIDNGIIAFHDTIGWAGPKRVVKEDVARSNHFKNLKFVHSITIGQKVLQNSRLDRIRNRYVILLKNLYEIVHNQNPPKIVRRFFIHLFNFLQSAVFN